MRKILFLILLIGAIFLVGCVENRDTFPKGNDGVESVECLSDNDCSVGGCSGQVCGMKDKVKGVITTCEFRESYNCLKLTNCGCVDGKCQWVENQDYKNCMEELK